MPIDLIPWNIVATQEIGKETGSKVYNILQLRLQDSFIALKNKIDNGPQNKTYDVDLTYKASRGHLYHTSWKGEISKFGGIATNIGVHFFDMLYWLFGPIQKNIVHIHQADRAAGYLEFAKARVRWFLSINTDILPETVLRKGSRTYRSILIEGEEFEFSDGFTNLHTRSYQHILDGLGFGIGVARPAIEIVHAIRNTSPIGITGDYHPFLKAHTPIS